MNIQIPDTSKGQLAITFVKGVWYALYYKDGKSCRKSLKTDKQKKAIVARDHFFNALTLEGATIYSGRTSKDKIKTKASLYIYTRAPYIFKVGAKVLCESWDRAVVEAARDAYVFGKAN